MIHIKKTGRNNDEIFHLKSQSSGKTKHFLKGIKTFLTATLTFFCFITLLPGQTNIISSESSYIKIQNKTTIIAGDDLTTPLPFTIVYPKFARDRSLVTEVNQINLIGKLADLQNTRQIFINNEEIEISKEGLFFKVIDLVPGKNNSRIKTVLKSGKIIIVNFTLEYKTGS